MRKVAAANAGIGGRNRNVTSRLARLGDLAYRRRGRMVLAWLAATVLIIALGSALKGEFNADYNTPGSESKAASDITEQRFGGYSGQEIFVAWKDAGGAMSPAARRRLDAFFTEAQKVEHVAPHTPIRVSRDRTIGASTLPLTVPGWDVTKDQGQQLIGAANRNSEGGLQIKLGGDPIHAAEGQSSPEGIGFVAAAIVLLIAFGSLVAAGLPLVIALIGLGISSGGLIVLLANAIDVPDWTTAVAGLIGIGVGIDYALLVLTRFRTALTAGKDVRDAIVEAVSSAGRSVIVVAASVTLLPALLALAGRRVDRLHIPGLGRSLKTGGGTLATRWSRVVQRRAAVAAVAGSLVLIALAAPVLGIRWGFPDEGNSPAGSTTREAYELVTRGFGAGANGPLVVAAELPNSGLDELTRRF